jgi:hypothetical protein
MPVMMFTDHSLTVASEFGLVSICIAGDALQALWDRQRDLVDADAVIAASHSLIDEIAIMKFEASEVEDDGNVRILAADLNA